MDLISNPTRKSMMALTIEDSIKFLQFNSLPRRAGVLKRNDFTLIAASMPELPQHVDSFNINCMVWCRYGKSNSANSVAIGLEDGSVHILWPKQSDFVEYPSNTFLYQATRPCKTLSWNKAQPELLALGFERNRNESSMLILDLFHETLNREHVSGLLENRTMQQKMEACYAESVNSVMWTDDDPKCLFAGVNGKHLRLYDIRNLRNYSQAVNTKSVFGLCQDPCMGTRFASFFENQVNVWDLRSFSKPAAVITTKCNVLKAEWCPTRNGLLATISGASSEGQIIRVYDTSHTVAPDSDSDIAYRHVEQLVRLPMGANENVKTFSWSQDSENEVIAVSNTSTLHCLHVPERISLSWTCQSQLVTACKEIRKCFNNQVLSPELKYLSEIEQIMYKRSQNSYGLDDDLDHSSAEINLEPNNSSLSVFWKWLKMAKESFPIPVTKEMKPPSFQSQGVKPMWGRSSNTSSVLSGRFCGLLKELRQTTSTSETVEWIGIPNSSCVTYKSAQRSRALKMCGWVSIKELREGSIDFKPIRTRSNNIDRETALSLWHLDMRQAIDILKTGSGDSNLQYSIVAMALSGYTGSNASSLWNEMCENLQKDMPSPYLRAAFAFLNELAGSDGNFHRIMQIRDLSVADRIGFACTFLNDELLIGTLEELCEDSVRNGDLEGVIATGLTTEQGVSLLQCYVENTRDVQTAALGLIQGGSADPLKNPTASFVIQSYRSLLNKWQLWKERACFDIVLGKSPPGQKYKHHIQGVFVQCTYCAKSVMHDKNVADFRGRGGIMQFSNTTSKAISCPKCHKPLPKCALCCMGLGTTPANSDSPDPHLGDESVLNNFFTWCSQCQHGGHFKHVKHWFSEHTECPVAGCPCFCCNYDSYV